MRKPLSIVALLALTATLASARAQWGGSQTDSNPYNPANWQISSEVSGTGKQIYITWDAETATVVRTPINLLFPWAEIGVDVQVPVTGQEQASCQGKLKFKVKWIGNGPPPDKVLVHLFATARRRGEGSSELGLPVLYDEDLGNDSYETGGELYRLLTLNGDTAETTVEGSASTVHSWPASTWSGSSVDWRADGLFALRALGISTDNVPTYHRVVGLDGVAYQGLDDVNDISERTMTMGYSLSEFGDDLVGSVGFTAGARTVGDWVLPATGQWTGSGLTTFETSDGSSAQVAATASQGQLLLLSATDDSTNGHVSLFYQESYPRPNGQSLPGMSSKLIVNMHAPMGFIDRVMDLGTGAEHPLVDQAGQMIYAVVNPGDPPQTFTISESMTITHQPKTWSISPGVDVNMKTFVTLKIGGNLAGSTSTQDAYQNLRSRTIPTPGPGSWQLVAEEHWQVADDTFARYGPHGFAEDHHVLYEFKNTFGLNYRWKSVGGY